MVVAMSGGFRLHFGDVRLAVTSPYRLLAVALALALARHWAAPSAPVYRDLPRRLRTWWQAPGVKPSSAVLVGTRPAVLLVGYLAVIMIGYPDGRVPQRLSQNELVNLPSRWDAGWYLGIVLSGYEFDSKHVERQQNVVFFPAYPLIVRGVGRLLGGRTASYSGAGVLVSLVAFFGALIYLFGLARDMLDDDHAVAALWLLAAYPFALFYSAYYTESLYLLGVAGAFFHFTRRQYWIAALWGLLVGLTRPNGFFLSAPLAVLAVASLLPRAVVGGSRPAQPPPPRLAGAVAVAAPIIGMLVYSIYVGGLTGNPLAWISGQVGWGRKYQGLAALAVDRYDLVSRLGVEKYVTSAPTEALNALAVLFVLGTAWPVARRLGLAYAVFILINILPPLAQGGFLSGGRFSAVLFPAFFWLAAVLPQRQRTGWIATFAAIQGLNAALFYTWRPLF